MKEKKNEENREKSYNNPDTVYYDNKNIINLNEDMEEKINEENQQ